MHLFKNKMWLWIIACIVTINALAKIEDVSTNILAQEHELSWAEISKKSKNAVLQIFSYTKDPHCFAMYKTPEDGGGTGTGFIINKNGEVLTNFHVVDRAIKLFAQHPGLSKERFELEFVGACPEQDVALLRLKKNDCAKIKRLLGLEDLPNLALGDSDEIAEAQEIMTLGYPIGQENIKSSCGDVSGRESTPLGECIQTTTPVNPGNSGGPFLNKYGKVIGLCVLKAVETEIEGIAYLIPINNVKRLMPQLRNAKIIRRPYWGFSYQPINDTMIEYLNFSLQNGVFITKIFKGSLFERSGFIQGDVICNVNNEAVDRYGYIHGHVSLIDYLNTIEFGSSVNVEVYREGEYKTINFTVEQSDSFKINKYYYGYESLPDYEIVGGLVITELTLNQIEIGKLILARNKFIKELSNLVRYDEDENRLEPKLIISYIIPGSEIANSRCLKELIMGAGIPSDFVIDEVNDIKVSTLEEFREAVLQMQDYLKIKMENGGLIVISLEQLVREDFVLSQQEGFERSKLVDALIEGASQEGNVTEP